VSAGIEHPPTVRLTRSGEGSIAPAIFAFVAQGTERHPREAHRLRGLVELCFAEGYPSIAINFCGDLIEVGDGPEDAPDDAPDTRITAPLPDFIHLTTAPLLGGIPNPLRPHGRAALSRIANKRVRVEGDRGLARRMLRVLALDLAPRGGPPETVPGEPAPVPVEQAPPVGNAGVDAPGDAGSAGQARRTRG
jgi:hypothetical protein